MSFNGDYCFDTDGFDLILGSFRAIMSELCQWLLTVCSRLFGCYCQVNVPDYINVSELVCPHERAKGPSNCDCV